MGEYSNMNTNDDKWLIIFGATIAGIVGITLYYLWKSESSSYSYPQLSKLSKSVNPVNLVNLEKKQEELQNKLEVIIQRLNNLDQKIKINEINSPAESHKIRSLQPSKSLKRLDNYRSHFGFV